MSRNEQKQELFKTFYDKFADISHGYFFFFFDKQD